DLSSPAKKLLQRGGVGIRGQALTDPFGERDDPVPPLWRAQNSANRRKTAALEKLRSRDIGCDHEILDQLLGPILLIQLKVVQPVAIEHRAGLERVERQRATRMAKLLHRLCDSRLDAWLLVHAGARRYWRR